ncbi:AsnC family transcriptional regulator [Ignicoccus pacificus DSM 13166]|uniref:AsnC family transcriptional regulator n=1 Tax=Ignicoccus pacificus DSM 13166 TaxID=940294 RepID=A0A977KB73_9CREN|nr:AsnC family transcriptional regulator [Ignicoccus pacificus DSM 13166]
MARVYLLIKVDSGKENDVYEALKNLPYVKTVDIVTGPLDLVAVFEADNLSRIEEVILNRVRRIEGIRETTTLIALTD